MAMKDPMSLREAFFDIIEEQIQCGSPAETRQTFYLLLRTGYTGSEALQYIAVVFAVELYAVMESHHAFNEARFTEHLRGLPALPWQFMPLAHPSFRDEPL
jgi:hypothetical protein